MSQHPECNCHECTQARYRMSFRYQLDQALNPIQGVSQQLPAPVAQKEHE